jgi:hypothetical protein
VREKAAQEDVLVLHLIRNAIGQTYFVVADCEPARKERINQNRGVTADQSRGTFFGALISLKERGIGCPKMKFERFDERVACKYTRPRIEFYFSLSLRLLLSLISDCRETPGPPPRNCEGNQWGVDRPARFSRKRAHTLDTQKPA